MLKQLSKKVKEETFLASFDVINLYTNISHDYELEAILFSLDQYAEEIPERVSKEITTEKTQFIL